MTKQEWENETNINNLIYQLPCSRKRRLFALACCRSIEHLLTDQRSKNCLNRLELLIDRKIDKKEFQSIREIIWATTKNVLTDTSHAAHAAVVWSIGSDNDCGDYAYSYYETIYTTEWAAKAGGTKQFEILRDIYNPFLLNLTFPAKAISLAEEVYNTQDQIARLVLSDFLEENHFPPEIYLHLKSGFHPKGCWLIDQILGHTL